MVIQMTFGGAPRNRLKRRKSSSRVTSRHPCSSPSPKLCDQAHRLRQAYGHVKIPDTGLERLEGVIRKGFHPAEDAQTLMLQE